MRKTISILVLSAWLAVGGCGSDEEEGGGGAEGAETAASGQQGSEGPSADRGLPGDPDAGEAIYQRTCVACHGADGRGNGGVTGADFVGDASRLAKSNRELLRSIRDGVTTGSQPMPAQRDNLSEEEMRDVLSYIRREFGGTE